MPTTDDEIQEKYLERAIRELNQLTHELQDCAHCPRGNLMPVLGSGHPQADIILLKYAPTRRRDRGGGRLLRPLRQRADEELQAARDRPARRLRDALRQVPASPTRRSPPASASRRVVEEVAIVEPRMHRRDGRAGAREPQRRSRSRWPRRSSREPGEIQALTPTIDVIYAPDIDASLDSEGPKREFWRAFRAVGEWYEDLPPVLRAAPAPGCDPGSARRYIWESMRAVGQLITFVSTVVAALIIGFGVPLGWIWIGSQMQSGSGASTVNFSVAMVILSGSSSPTSCCSTWPGS